MRIPRSLNQRSALRVSAHFFLPKIWTMTPLMVSRPHPSKVREALHAGMRPRYEEPSMSLDTIAIFDVATPLEPVSLVERLAVEPAIVALADRYGAQWNATEWSLEPSQVHERG